MPLSLMSVGTRNRIKAVTGHDGVRKHLATLGFVEGAEVSIIGELNGNLILGVMDSRVAIDKKLAERILV